MKEKQIIWYKKDGSVYCVLDGSTEGFQIWEETLTYIRYKHTKLISLLNYIQV